MIYLGIYLLIGFIFSFVLFYKEYESGINFTIQDLFIFLTLPLFWPLMILTIMDISEVILFKGKQK